jgi:proteasome accessory factor C
MVESASARAQRLLDLVPFLHSHPGTTVGEVAGHFGISKSDVIKDLNLLFLCGLPGYTHLELIDISFDDEVITVIDAQNLKSPRRLTELEAIALRIALQALSEILPGSHGSQRKISALLENWRECTPIPCQAMQSPSKSPQQKSFLQRLKERSTKGSKLRLPI